MEVGVTPCNAELAFRLSRVTSGVMTGLLKTGLSGSVLIVAIFKEGFESRIGRYPIVCIWVGLSVRPPNLWVHVARGRSVRISTEGLKRGHPHSCLP